MAKPRSAGVEQLTDLKVKQWLRKPDGEPYLHDGGGLYLRRRADGAFWALRQVNPLNGSRTWAALFPGVSYPEATMAEARKRASAARLRATEEPTDLVRDRRAAVELKRAGVAAAEAEARRRITVLELFARWAATDLAPRVSADGSRLGRKDGGEYVRQQFERRLFPALGGVPVHLVSKSDLMTLLDKVKAEGKLRTANVLLTDMKQMFAFALERDHIERNPLDTVTRRKVGGAETQRDRVLSTHEVAALAEVVPMANMGKRSVAAIWLILATGVRVSEAMAARWEHVDLIGGTWHLPITKNERTHTIHLSDFAKRQFSTLEALREVDASGRTLPWVFPNTKGSDSVCIKSFGKQLADRQRPPERRMKNRTARTGSLLLPGGRWTAHDLRRTAATMMAELGISGDVIDECLNHVIESRVRRTYVRDRRLVEQARAFDALGARLSVLVGDTVAPNVYRFAVAA